MASRSERRAAGSHCERLIEDLLKLAFSPATRPRGQWRHTVRQYRRELERLGCGVHGHLEDRLPRLYERARRRVARDLAGHHGYEAAALLPDACPWTLRQILDPDFEPARRWHLRSARPE